MRSYDKLLSVLGLFTLERYQWSAPEAAKALNISVSTAYRYFKSLSDAGLLTATSPSTFGLGPAIIAMDRLIQMRDPILQTSMPVMTGLLAPNAPPDSAIVLARLYQDTILCVHQIRTAGPQTSTVTFERGRPLPLMRGATSRIILANLPTKALRKIYEKHKNEAAESTLGATWDEFNSQLRRVRREGLSVARGEVDVGRVGIAAPVFGPNAVVQGSLAIAIPEHQATENAVRRLSSFLLAATHEIRSGFGILEQNGAHEGATP